MASFGRKQHIIRSPISSGHARARETGGRVAVAGICRVECKACPVPCANWETDLCQRVRHNRNTNHSSGCTGGDEAIDRESARGEGDKVNLQFSYTPNPLQRGDSAKIPCHRRDDKNTAEESFFSSSRIFAVYSDLAVLLYFAFRNAPLDEIWRTLLQLQSWQIAILFGLNLFIYALITLRWWIIVRAENKLITYFPLLLVRVAVFGVSYFTFGPHVGGEPLQVFYLQRKYKLTFTHATASVIMDKLLELLANFFLLAVGLTAIFQSGILSTNGGSSWLSLSGLVILCIWPPIHIVFLYKKKYPGVCYSTQASIHQKGFKGSAFHRRL